MDELAVSRLHYELISGLIQRSAPPTNSELAEKFAATEEEIRDLLRGLSAIHGVVLHPHVCEPWIVHPFSLTPTLNWIEGENGSWWAPCIWCALGVSALVGGATRIHTRLGAEAEPLILSVTNGKPCGTQDIWVHFAIPPSRAWDNVHQHCSLVLPFRSPAHIQQWCRRYGKEMGEAVPLLQVADLARVWYGSHGNPQWKKWTVAQAQEIFTQVGLTSGFWHLESRSGRF